MFENNLETSNLPRDSDYKLKGSSSSLYMIFGVVSLTLVLTLPSRITAWFDGLPWTGELETLVLIVIVPFLTALGWRFLSLRLPVIFLAVLLVLKIVLFWISPSSGWLVKVHTNMTQEQLNIHFPFQTVEDGGWVNTYATNWNQEASGILKNSWTEKLSFPLDWALIHKIKWKKGLPGCGVSGGKCFDELSPIVEIDGALIIPDGEKFILIAEGVQDGTLLATNEKGEKVVILPAKNREEATQSQYHFLQAGKWKVSGKLHYEGKNWSLIPTLVGTNGEISSNIGREVLWQNAEVLSKSLEHIGFYKIYSFIVDGGIFIFLLAWSVWTILSLADKQILNLPLALSSITLVFLPAILAPVYSGLLTILGSPDATTVSYLGFSMIPVCLGFLIWTQWKKDFRNYQANRITPSVFILFGPALLFFFANKWWSILGQWKVWGSGDDWAAYQFFARKIVVEGEWLNAGTGILYPESNSFILQPLYRYIIGIYHWLFGQSAFAQHMSDVWCVMGATLIIVSFAMKFRVSPLVIFISSITYLAINLISSFRYHIGRGLVENHAMIFMMLAAWFIYVSRDRGGYRIILATLFGILGYWTRQDHLGAIAGLAFLALEPVEGPTGGWKGYWERFQSHWRKFAIYWGFGITSVLLICFRNWWLGGSFFITTTDHPNLDLAKYSPFPDSIYIVLSGKILPAFPGVFGFIVISGVFIALLALVWRPKELSNFPLGLSISILGLIIPYAFLMTWGYPPRYTIHLLPLALLSLALLIRRDETKSPIKNKT
jgi:hypothetical protein